MRKRNLPKKRTSKVRRQRDPIPWKYCFLTLICGLFLVSGFFWAARSHFSSMDYGMKNAKLRKQIEDLKSETRRLKLAREIALSPAEIKKAAKKLGLTTMTARNIEVVGQKKKLTQKKSTSENLEKLDPSEIKEDKAKTPKNKKKAKEKDSKKKNKTEKLEKNKKKERDSFVEAFRKNGSTDTEVTRR